MVLLLDSGVRGACTGTRDFWIWSSLRVSHGIGTTRRDRSNFAIARFFTLEMLKGRDIAGGYRHALCQFELSDQWMTCEMSGAERCTFEACLLCSQNFMSDKRADSDCCQTSSCAIAHHIHHRTSHSITLSLSNSHLKQLQLQLRMSHECAHAV